ncbi:MAG: lipopolysaccharide export system protein LptC, partial [Pseudomonadota bacterium]|nr:lipopolysaccharide export system protein LptC [Pseudomonadota bacterium]
DDVQIKRDATPTRAALFGYMADLTIHTEEENASTKTPVLFTQGKSWLKGVGMHIDNKTQTYVLESQAVGQFESRTPKAKP